MSHANAVSCISDLRIIWMLWPNTAGPKHVCLGDCLVSPSLQFCCAWSCQKTAVVCCTGSCMEEVFWADACTKCQLVAFMWFWWLFWSPVCVKALKLLVLKALMCSQFPSMWQSCGVGLATFSSLSFLIMTVFVQVIFASVHPSLPCRCNYAFLMPLNCKDLGKTLSTSLMAKCNTSFSSFGVVTLVCSKH